MLGDCCFRGSDQLLLAPAVTEADVTSTNSVCVLKEFYACWGCDFKDASREAGIVSVAVCVERRVVAVC